MKATESGICMDIDLPYFSFHLIGTQFEYWIGVFLERVPSSTKIDWSYLNIESIGFNKSAD
jgi:hypothetical protein